MDKVIVTALLTIGAVTAALVVIFSLGPSISSSGQAVSASSNEAADRIGTSIEIIVVAPNAAGTQIDAWVKNVGVQPISPVSASDVFVITPGTRYDAMTYNAAGGVDKTWKDDPVGSSWNRSDTLHIIIDLSASALTTGDHQLRVSTRNGITTDMTFSH